MKVELSGNVLSQIICFVYPENMPKTLHKFSKALRFLWLSLTPAH